MREQGYAEKLVSPTRTTGVLRRQAMRINPKNGGRVIVMGDGMVSLYMTSWKGVDDYQCAEFMHDVFRWLLHETD
jgi:hypothetical protein